MFLKEIYGLQTTLEKVQIRKQWTVLCKGLQILNMTLMSFQGFIVTQQAQNDNNERVERHKLNSFMF